VSLRAELLYELEGARRQLRPDHDDLHDDTIIAEP
jgi:hypothetical protein